MKKDGVSRQYCGDWLAANSELVATHPGAVITMIDSNTELGDFSLGARNGLVSARLLRSGALFMSGTELASSAARENVFVRYSEVWLLRDESPDAFCMQAGELLGHEAASMPPLASDFWTRFDASHVAMGIGDGDWMRFAVDDDSLLLTFSTTRTL